MRALATILAAQLLTGAARAQVINGQSTDDAAYAPRPPARWHSPESEGEIPGGKPQNDERENLQTEKPRR